MAKNARDKSKTKRINKSKAIGLSSIVVSSVVFASLLGIFIGSQVQKSRLQHKIDQATQELKEVFAESEKLKDDEYYQLYYFEDSDHIITNGDKVIIDFAK